jgi:NitT/TauT family transport system ATP-binding protein
MVFQTFDQLFPWKTLGQNVAYAMKLSGEHREAEVDRWLEAVELTDAKDQYPRALSGGMRQRGALARALAHDPAVLLLDEPFGSLDEGLKRKLGEMVVRLQRQTQKTFLFVTHDLEEALRLADEILILEAKDRLVSLTPEAAVTHPFFLSGTR